MKHYFIACPQERVNAGERGYVYAILQELYQKTDITIHLLKITDYSSAEEINEYQAPEIADLVATTAEQYSRIPYATEDRIQVAVKQVAPQDNVVMIGSGHSTLRLLAELQTRLQKITSQIDASWVTHMVNEAWQIQLLNAQGITLVIPRFITREILQHIDPAAAEINIDPIDGTPTGTTKETIAQEYQRFTMYNPVGIELKRRHKPYIAWLVNSGFDEKSGALRSVPPLQEFYEQGLALGRCVPVNLDLVIIHSSPRSLADEVHYRTLDAESEIPVEAMSRGYRAGQREQDDAADPMILIDRIDAATPSGEKTNGALAMLACPSTCRLVILNDEGEGGKFDAARFADLSRVICYASSICDHDPQRLASRWHYDGLGITSVTAGTLQEKLAAKHVEKT